MVGQSSDKLGHFRSLLVIPDQTPYSCIKPNNIASKKESLMAAERVVAEIGVK